MTKYAIFKILDDSRGDVLTIDARWEIEDSIAPKLGVWALKSKATIITEEQMEKLKGIL